MKTTTTATAMTTAEINSLCLALDAVLFIPRSQRRNALSPLHDKLLAAKREGRLASSHWLWKQLQQVEDSF